MLTDFDEVTRGQRYYPNVKVCRTGGNLRAGDNTALQVGLYRSGTYYDCSQAGAGSSISNNALNSAGCVTQAVDCVIPNGLTGGFAYQFYGKIDIGGSVTESDESNNTHIFNQFTIVR